MTRRKGARSRARAQALALLFTTPMKIAVALLLLLVACADAQPPTTGSLDEGILNGTRIAPNETGFVFIINAAGETCSGTLVSASWVLTARHCFNPEDSENPSGVRVQMGRDELNFPIERNAIEIVLHLDLDVALVRLDSDFAMPIFAYDKSIFAGDVSGLVGQTLSCFGYGRGTVNTPSGTLRTADLVVGSASGGTVNVRRNAQGQIMYLGDSGGSCVLNDPSGAQVIVGVTVLCHGPSETDITNCDLVAGLGSWVSEVLMDRVLIGDDGYCVDVPNDSHDIQNLQTFPCHRNGNQRWRFNRGLDGRFAIQGADSNKCFDVPNGSSGFVVIQQYPCHGGNNQRFHLYEVGSRLEIRSDTNTCLHPRWDHALEQTTCLGSPYQPTWGIENRPLGGRRNLVSLARGQCADVQTGGTASGLPIQRFPCAQVAANQEWRFIPSTSDYFQLRPRNSERCFTNGSGSIAQQSCAGLIDQDWRLQLHADFTYEIWTHRYPTTCVATSAASALLTAATCSVSNDQRWNLPWR